MLDLFQIVLQIIIMNYIFTMVTWQLCDPDSEEECPWKDSIVHLAGSIEDKNDPGYVEPLKFKENFLG